MKIHLTSDNYSLYAAQHYDCAFPDPQEFAEDLKRIVYIKRLLNQYLDKGELRERLILNHIIILTNMFGIHGPVLLFFKLSEYKSLLKTFLTYLNMMPNRIEFIDSQADNIYNDQISLDPIVWKNLQLL
jgi:hypothetical protein